MTRKINSCIGLYILQDEANHFYDSFGGNSFKSVQKMRPGDEIIL
jgi:hypothetical protein